MNGMPCVKQVRSSALRFHGDLIQLMAETCRGVILTCQCQEAPNVSFGNRPEMGKACGPNSPFSVKLFGLFDHFITPWKLESESEATQSCPTLCNPMDCSLPGSSVHGIFQAIVLEWVAISFSRESSDPGMETRISHCQVDSLPRSHLGHHLGGMSSN